MSILDPQLAAKIRPILDSSGFVTTATAGRSPEDRALEDYAQAVETGAPSEQYQTFTPENLEERTALQGGIGDSFAQAFDEGILGAMFNPETSLKAQEQAQIRAMNYAEDHGVWSFMSAMAGGLASDAPIDIGLALTGAGLGASVTNMALKFRRIPGLMKAAKAVRDLRRAYQGVGGSAADRLVKRGTYEAMIGMTAAYISDRIQMEGDRYKSADEVLNRMVMEGTASLFFAEGFRQVGKIPGALKEANLKNDLNKELPPGQKVEDPKAADRALTSQKKDDTAPPTEDTTAPAPENRATTADDLEPTEAELDKIEAEESARILAEESAPEIKPEDFDPQNIAEMDDVVKLEAMRLDVEKQLEDATGEVDPQLLENDLILIDSRIEEITAETPEATATPEPEAPAEPEAKPRKRLREGDFKGDKKRQVYDAGDGKQIVIKKTGDKWVIDAEESNIQVGDLELDGSKRKAVKMIQSQIDEGKIDFDSAPVKRNLVLGRPEKPKPEEKKVIRNVRRDTGPEAKKAAQPETKNVNQVSLKQASLLLVTSDVGRGLMQRIMRATGGAIDNIKVKIGEIGAGRDAEYNYRTDEITVRPDLDEARLEEVVMHETNHAATVRRLAAMINEFEIHEKAASEDVSEQLATLKGPEAFKDWLDDLEVDDGHVLRELNDLWERAMLGKAQGSTSQWMDNPLEFLAMAFSDNMFRQSLASIKSKDAPKSSMWDEFVKWVGDVLNLDPKDRNLLRDTFKVIEDIASEDEPVFGSGGVDNPTLPAKAKAEPKEKAKTKRQKTIEAHAKKAAAKARAKARSKAISEKVVTAAKENLGEGSGAARTSFGLKMMNLRDKARSFLTTDNRHIPSLLKGMGQAGTMLRSLQQSGLNIVAGYKNELRATMNNIRQEVNKARTQLNKKHTIELSVLDKKKTDKTPATYTTKQFTVTGRDLTYIYMKAWDGVRKGKPDKKTGTKRALVDEKQGIILGTERVVLDPKSVSALQAGVGVPTELTSLADSLWGFYRTSAVVFNKRGKQLTGKDNIFDLEHKHYSPSSMAQTKSVREYADVLSSNLLGERVDPDVVGRLKARKGGGIVEMTDPVTEAFRYYDSVSETMGMADFTNAYVSLINNPETSAAIRQYYGKSQLKTMTDFSRIMTGRPSDVLGDYNPVTSTLMSLRAMAFLGWNPSVAAKQLGSSWSADATGLLVDSGLTMVTRAGRYAKPGSKMRGQVVAEMMEHSPFFRDRKEGGMIDPDLADVLDALGLSSEAFSDANPTTLKDMLKFKGVNVGEKFLKYVQLGMKGIRHMDEATMASVWQATRKTIDQNRVDLKSESPEYWKEVNRLFTEVAIDSQPTYNKTTRSINQLRRGVLFKAINQFTGQTAKNYGLAIQAVQEFANIPNRTPEDTKKLMKTLMPLAYQTAYITAVHSGIAWGTVEVAEHVFGADQNKRSRMQKSFDNVLTENAAYFLKNVVGQIPGGGSIAADAAMAIMGGPVYGMNIPVINEGTEILQGVSDRKLGKVVKGVTTFLGAPRYAFRLTGQ